MPTTSVGTMRKRIIGTELGQDYFEMSKLGTNQWYVFSQYVSCKKRTKKNISFRDSKADEELVKFMLENSSQTEDKGERSLSETRQAIDNICKKLCPGEWCTCGHCQHCRSGYAYQCSNGTRPAVCKKFKKWREGQKKREQKTL